MRVGKILFIFASTASVMATTSGLITEKVIELKIKDYIHNSSHFSTIINNVTTNSLLKFKNIPSGEIKKMATGTDFNFFRQENFQSRLILADIFGEYASSLEPKLRESALKTLEDPKSMLSICAIINKKLPIELDNAIEEEISQIEEEADKELQAGKIAIIIPTVKARNSLKQDYKYIMSLIMRRQINETVETIEKSLHDAEVIEKGNKKRMAEFFDRRFKSGGEKALKAYLSCAKQTKKTIGTWYMAD